MQQYAKNHGITWVGITVIIAILLVLLVFLYPVFQNASRPISNNCLSNQRQIALAMQMYAQDHGNVLPGALSWHDGTISSSHKKWVSDLALSGKILHCQDSNARMSYGMPVALAGTNISMVPESNIVDVMLSADARAYPGIDPANADGLIFSKADINTAIHGYVPTTGFIASFLDGHVSFVTTGITDAVDATFTPASPIACPFSYQGADHLFVIDGEKGTVTGKSFTSTNPGRVQYIAFYYATFPTKGQLITIKAPGGAVTLVTPTQGQYCTIFVRPIDVKHTITASLKGTTLTIINNAIFVSP